jgi:hypothetical protein
MARFETLHRVRTAASEYFNEVAPGAWRDGVQCQDVQRLTFADASFDVCTSTEVFDERFSAAFLGHGSAVVCGRA